MNASASIRLGVSHQRPEDLTEDRFRYLRQMGVEAMEVRLPEANADYDELCRIRDKVGEADFELFEVMPADLYDFPRASIGAPGGDEEFARFRRFLQDLGRAGITRTTYAWRTGGVYQTGRTVHRESDTRLFSLDAVGDVPAASGPGRGGGSAHPARVADDRPAPPATGMPASPDDGRPLPADGALAEEDVWYHYRRFLREVLPAAHDAGVLMQLHPNDPPVSHHGIPRIFRSSAAYGRAWEMAEQNPSWGILFCVGTWAEMTGPDGKGEDIAAALRHFVPLGCVQQIHFRNVSSPLPEFYETYPDAGYLDMKRIFDILAETGFTGMVVPDHVPIPHGAVDGKALAEAYSFGYIRALIQGIR